MSASSSGKLLDVVSKVKSPDSAFNVTVHGQEFSTEAFGDVEANLFDAQLNQLMAGINSSVLTGVLQQKQDMISNVAAYAKAELDGKNFGGINAGDNQVGFSVLRPGHIFSDSSGTLQNDWYFDPGTQGWTDWIGDGTQANNYSVSEDQVSVVLAFVDQDTSTEVSGLNIKEWDRSMDMLPHDLNNARLRDNENEIMVDPLPTLIATEGTDIHARLRYDRDVESQPRLFGITFGVGEFLNSDDY